MPGLDLHVVGSCRRRQRLVRGPRSACLHVGLHLGLLLGGHFGCLLASLREHGRDEKRQGGGLAESSCQLAHHGSSFTVGDSSLALERPDYTSARKTSHSASDSPTYRTCFRSSSE